MKIKREFFWRYEVCSLVALLCGLIPPVIVDRLLVHHVRFGPREYPRSLWIIPLLCLVLVVGNHCLKKCAISPYFLLLSFAVASSGSLLVFPEERPHMGVLTVVAIWLATAACGIFVHTDFIKLEESTEVTSGEQSVVIEYLKTELLWWNTALWGLLAAMLAVVVAWQKNNADMAIHVVGDVSEQFILISSGGIQTGTLSLLVLSFPIFEIGKMRRAVANVLLKLSVKGGGA